ncbi:hypothetical protein NXW13_13905 [Bacteroides thetaiotaomicron]|nr:hypothetical protein [Bacteroides thetaiotaomicron]
MLFIISVNSHRKKDKELITNKRGGKRGNIFSFSPSRPRTALRKSLDLKFFFTPYMLGFVACKQISSYRFWASAMSFTTYCIPDTFAEKQDMDPILKQQLLAFILGGSFLSTITGFVTLKYTKKAGRS